MLNVYQECPSFENEKYKIRFLSQADWKELLRVYSDKKSVPFFNSDNCGGDDFYYTSEKKMKEAINYWLFEYERKGFVRWCIKDKRKNIIIGTIEIFHRTSDDFFTNCALLRLDLRSDYEKKQRIKDILSLILTPALSLFCCDKIATKAIPEAIERRAALEELEFYLSEEKLIGHQGEIYDSYFVLKEENLKS